MYTMLYIVICFQLKGALQCGKPLVAPRGRVIGGKAVDPNHSQPWVAVVDYCNGCGGTLISNEHVLTAGHCVASPEFGRTVILGDHNCKKYDSGELSVAVKRKSIHPNCPKCYIVRDWKADIAVLTLEEPVQFSSTILPACLPTEPIEHYFGRKVTASGWGIMGNGTSLVVGPNSGTLMTVELKVLPTCEWPDVNMTLHNIPMNETYMFCTGNTNERNNPQWMGLHEGDSGGKLGVN